MRFGRLLVVGEDVDDALLRGDEDALLPSPAWVSTMGRNGFDLAGGGLRLPAGPLEVGKGDGRFERQRRVVDLRAGN